MPASPPLVTLHLWGVARRHVPGAVVRMGTHRRPLRRTEGIGFHKLLGTGDGRTFTVRDADPRHWGVLATWARPTDAAAFDSGAVVRSWDAIAEERLRVVLRPLSARGTWARHTPFGDPVPRPSDGPVAAITRARLVPAKAVTFWRAVPPVSADVHAAAGLRLAVGVGEAPVGLQGTFSVWDSAPALNDFAYGRAAHLEAIRRTASTGWYAEELFARFSVVEAEGSFAGVRL